MAGSVLGIADAHPWHTIMRWHVTCAFGKRAHACMYTQKYTPTHSAAFYHQHLHGCLCASWLSSAYNGDENRLPSVIIYTFLSSADINVSNPLLSCSSLTFCPTCTMPENNFASWCHWKSIFGLHWLCLLASGAAGSPIKSLSIQQSLSKW